MKRGAAAAFLVALALVVVAAVILIRDEEPTWSITYETGGGQLPDGSPTGYSEGDEFPLPEPVQEGFVFLGWFSDSGMTAPVPSISPGMSGDLVLYASWIEAEKHSVTYVLGGGSLPDGSEETFIGGLGMVLPTPERDGYRFAGWFEDGGFETPVVVIGTDVLADVTVYACWDPEDRVGTGMTWDVSGEYYNGSIRHTMSGTVTQEYIAERDGAFYYETRYDITYRWPGGSSLNDSVTGSWTDSGGTAVSYIGVEEANGYMCTVWEDEDGQRYWLYHLDLQVRIALQEGTTDIVYDLSGTYEFVPESEFVPEVSAEYPLKVTGIGTVEIGDPLILTAEGDGFTGWYSGNTLVTEERTLEVERADPTCSYDARASDGYEVVDPGTLSLDEYGFGEGSVVTDPSGKPVGGSLSDLSPGYYRAQRQDGQVISYLEFFVEEIRHFTWSWSFQGTVHSISMDIRYSDVYRYTYDDPYDNIRISLTDPGYVAVYHTVGDAYLGEISRQLSAEGSSLDRADFARFVLSFVQGLDYLTDIDSAGREEYWKYPLETLWDGGGDCEDTTILCDTLLMMNGYDVAFLLFTDHAMTAVNVDIGDPGHRVHSVSDGDGTRYVFCETTSDWDIGVTSVGHTESDLYYWCPVVADGTV